MFSRWKLPAQRRAIFKGCLLTQSPVPDTDGTRNGTQDEMCAWSSEDRDHFNKAHAHAININPGWVCRNQERGRTWLHLKSLRELSLSTASRWTGL